MKTRNVGSMQNRFKLWKNKQRKPFDHCHSACSIASKSDKSAIVGGKQRIQTQNGHHVPLHTRDGLPCVAMRPFADVEWATLPHIELTKAANGTHDLWLPASIDHEHPTVLASTNRHPPHPSAPLCYEYWVPFITKVTEGKNNLDVT